MKKINEDHSKYVKLLSFTQGETSPTNKELVEDMILQIERLDDNMLKNPNNRFLDPCAGTGTCGVVLYNKLLQYHTHEWIMNNMIFMIDKSLVSCDILKRLGFVNVFHKDFLNENIDMKFDVVIGNPPYQNDTKSGSESLWIKFVKKSYDLSNIVCFVTPKTWCNLTKDSYDKKLFNIFKNHLQYVNLSDYLGDKYFKGIGSTFSYYIINKNKKNSGFTVEKDGDNYELNYNEIEWIPNNLSQTTLDILKKTLWSKEKKIKGQFEEITGYRKGGKFITDNGLYKVSNTSAQYSKELWIYTNTPQTIIDKPKVIFSDSGYNKPYFDCGEINLGHHSRAFFVNNEQEANELINFLHGDIVKFFINTMVPTGISIGFEKFAKYIPNNFKGINLTETEMKYINGEL